MDNLALMSRYDTTAPRVYVSRSAVEILPSGELSDVFGVQDRVEQQHMLTGLVGRSGDVSLAYAGGMIIVAKRGNKVKNGGNKVAAIQDLQNAYGFSREEAKGLVNTFGQSVFDVMREVKPVLKKPAQKKDEHAVYPTQAMNDTALEIGHVLSEYGVFGDINKVQSFMRASGMSVDGLRKTLKGNSEVTYISETYNIGTDVAKAVHRMMAVAWKGEGQIDIVKLRSTDLSLVVEEAQQDMELRNMHLNPMPALVMHPEDDLDPEDADTPRPQQEVLFTDMDAAAQEVFSDIMGLPQRAADEHAEGDTDNPDLYGLEDFDAFSRRRLYRRKLM